MRQLCHVLSMHSGMPVLNAGQNTRQITEPDPSGRGLKAFVEQIERTQRCGLIFGQTSAAVPPSLGDHPAVEPVPGVDRPATQFNGQCDGTGVEIRFARCPSPSGKCGQGISAGCAQITAAVIVALVAHPGGEGAFEGLCSSRPRVVSVCAHEVTQRFKLLGPGDRGPRAGQRLCPARQGVQQLGPARG